MRKLSAILGGAAAVGLAALLSIPQPAAAQATGASLAGRVADEQGGALPGVALTARSTSKGFTRTVTTVGDGTYRFASIPADTYMVTAQLTGFKTVEQTGVELNVATTRSLNFNMSLATATAAVTVTAETPLVRNEASIGAVVSEKELKSLPLNGRQFANVAVLAPGTSLAYNTDPTKPGQLTVALNGGIGRNVNYVSDGGDNTDDTIGGALQNFSLDSVQEFNIQTQQYKAEYGRSTGGVLTVVTKTGTNDFHGNGFGFFRDKGLNSETESEKNSGRGKQAYRRYQYGASLGGPVVQDKAHFFAAYERTDRKTNYTVDTRPSATSQPLYPAVQGQAAELPFTDDLVTAKGTVNLSASQYLQVRFGYQKNSDKYGASPKATPDSLGTVANKYSSILGGHSAQLGANAVNEFVIQYSKFDNTISSDSTNLAIAYPSGVHSGQNINTPQSTHQIKYQFKDDVSFGRDIAGQRHDFKVGFNVIHEPTLGGDFSTGVDAPQFTLKEDRAGSPVTDITRNGGLFTDSTPVNQYSVYIQDDWRPGPRITLSVGLRYDLWTGFDLDQRSNPIWKTLSTQTSYNENYLRDFQGGKGGVLSNDKKNWGPRLGFAWDVTGNGRMFVRGGWGIYYDFPYTNATILFPSAAVQSNYGVIYNNNNSSGIRNVDGSFFQPGQPLPPNQLSGLASNPPNEVASPTLKTPFSRQASLGVSTEVTPWLAASLDGVLIRYRNLPFRFRANPRVGNPPPQSNPRRFPDFGNFRIWYGNGFADYDGVNFSLRARISNTLVAQGFYTWSRTNGNVISGADEFRLSNTTYQPDLRRGRDVSVNPLDPLCNACSGPLNTDARHRFTLGVVYSAPLGITASGFFRYRSATPYNIHAGTDLNNDGFVIDLPPGVTHVNSGRGHDFSQFDIRLSKDFLFTKDVGVEVIAEAFNVFNSTNPAGYVGDMSSAAFGKPSFFAGDPLQGEQRLAQLGLRVHF
ncbi:MAG: TonB-dependent receptor [Acidobacteriota bacterium]